MTAEQIIKEVEALPKSERKRRVQQIRELGSDGTPRDFIDALEDFEKARSVSMETALNETSPGA
jgi:mRNA-degrading endonuclease RelE of RelBE toxin-antitoxin system